MTAADVQMDELTAKVRDEIRSLRKGRGLPAAELGPHRVPHLWELATGGASGFQPDRQRLVSELTSSAAALPDDLRTAIFASLGLSADVADEPQLTRRIAWLAEHIDRSYRVALRRVDLAEQLLAEQVARELLRRHGAAAGTPSGWYLEQFHTVLRLDTPGPEAHEHRRIVATRNDLREVMAWLDVPRDPEQPGPRLETEVLYGGQLVRREQRNSRFQYLVQLPSPLQPGDAHEYGLLLRVPAGEPMRPHYIFTPECECREFTLRVRFPADRPPVWVRRVEAETVRMFDRPEPGKDLLTPDPAGEVRVQFHDPVQYLGYGVQWSW